MLLRSSGLIIINDLLMYCIHFDNVKYFSQGYPLGSNEIIEGYSIEYIIINV